MPGCIVPIRVILADDHKVFREGVAGILKDYPEIELVDQASDGQKLLALVEQHRPDVVLTDIQMGPMDGFEAKRQIVKRFPKVMLIVNKVKMLLKQRDVHVTLSSPAKEYLQGRRTKLGGTYRRGGQRYYSETASRKVTALISGGFFDPDGAEVMGFDPTELRIIRLMCEDTDNADIAEELKISNITVTHRPTHYSSGNLCQFCGSSCSILLVVNRCMCSSTSRSQ